MADRSTGPSALAFWLEEALTGWILPVAALTALLAVAALYWSGLLPEQVTATLVSVIAPLTAALFVLRPALDPSRDRLGRLLAVATAVLAFACSAVPAVQAILPGDPLVQGDLGIEGETIAVPAGVSGRVRVLVSGKLRQGGDSAVAFSFAGPERPIEGRLERTYRTARIGRSGSARVAADHTSDFYEAVLPAGISEIRLDRLQGQLGGRLRLAVYRDWFPHSAMLLLALLVLILAGAADARLGLRGNAAIPAGMALAYGILVAMNATPAAAVGQAVGGVLLGAIVGSVAGAGADVLMRRFVQGPSRRGGKPPRDED